MKTKKLRLVRRPMFISFRVESSQAPKTNVLWRSILFSLLSFGSLNSVWAQSPQLYILNRGGDNILAVPLDSAIIVISEKIDQNILATYDFITIGASSKLYWTNSISHQILSSDEAGAGIVNATTAEVAVPVDLDFDFTNNKLYWVDNVRKKIYRSNPDGSAQEEITKDSFPDLSSIAIFPNKNLLFFADLDSSLIWTSSLSGDNVKVFISDSLDSPIRLLIDTIQQKLYWADDSQNRIERINLDGSGREIFYQGDKEEFPFGLYLDQTTAQLYWTDYGKDKIMRANLDGSDAKAFITVGLNDPVAVIIVTPLTPASSELQDRNGFQQEDNQNLIPPSLSVYPNPATSFITFTSLVGAQFIEQILIFDKGGKQIFTTNLIGNTVQVDVSLFPDGLYSYSAVVAGQMLHGRFSINR